LIGVLSGGEINFSINLDEKMCEVQRNLLLVRGEMFEAIDKAIALLGNYVSS